MISSRRAGRASARLRVTAAVEPGVATDHRAGADARLTRRWPGPAWRAIVAEGEPLTTVSGRGSATSTRGRDLVADGAHRGPQARVPLMHRARWPRAARGCPDRDRALLRRGAARRRARVACRASSTATAARGWSRRCRGHAVGPRWRWTQWWDQVTLPQALRRDGADVFLSPYYKAPLAAPCPTVVTIHDLFFIGYPGRHRPLYDATMTRLARLYARARRRDRGRLRAQPAPDRDASGAVGRADHGHPRGARPGVRPDGAEPGPARALQRSASATSSTSATSCPTRTCRGSCARLGRAARVAAPRASARAGRRRSRAPARARDGRCRSGPRRGVTFPGLIDDADLPAVYAGATAFVLPSLEEGFGLPALEAMACGTPVVVSRRGALPRGGRRRRPSGRRGGRGRADRRARADARRARRARAIRHPRPGSAPGSSPSTRTAGRVVDLLQATVGLSPALSGRAG